MPSGDPIIISSTRCGLLALVKIGHSPIAFGAHNDKPKNLHNLPESALEIIYLKKIEGNDNNFWSVSSSGMIRQWELSLQAIQMAQPQQVMGQ